jgi:SAM-dependent methyltransferase
MRYTVSNNIARGLPFRDTSFDLAPVFNVLYHDWVPDEKAVVHEIVRILRPGGVALFTEPAFPALSRSMDVWAMGRKRTG